MSRQFAAALAAMLLLLQGCGSRSDGQSPERGTAESAAPGAIPRIAVVAARDALAAGAVLVDVRETHELEQSGVLEGAVNMPMSSFAERASSLPRSQPIILYCRSGRRSEIAGARLRELGYAQVHNLGGFDAAVGGGWPTRRD